MSLKAFLAVLVAAAVMPGNFHAPALKTNQSYAFNDSLNSKSSTTITATGLDYKLPDPSHVESSQKILRTVSVIAVNDHGLPSQFRIKYGADETGDSAIAVAGREFEVKVNPSGVDVASTDGKDLSDADRVYLASEATKLIDYLAASAEFTAISIGNTDYQDISTQLIGRLLSIPQDQVKKASIKRERDAETATFDVRLVLAEAQDQRVTDAEMSGTMKMKEDWSLFEVALENKTTRTATYEKTQIQIDTSWSLALSRQFAKR